MLADFMAGELPLSDYVMVSGSLNYQQNDPDFIYKAISKLFESCTKGFAFNLLRPLSPTACWPPMTRKSY
ncbi:hypothetical protein [Mucilaginibacter pineti]|uniref:hypothetical protein n=1 Tax=Mucilaginibacter pineti TaxID=1391627 RepID=UPI001160098E|nr:hypothetical protein [Mucilaginibacter pineti]